MPRVILPLLRWVRPKNAASTDVQPEAADAAAVAAAASGDVTKTEGERGA